MEQYLASTRDLPERPLEIIPKAPPPDGATIPSPTPGASGRYHVQHNTILTNYGTFGTINVWDAAGPYGNDTSIGQTTVGRGIQSVEVGKLEHYSYGDFLPHLFVYYTTNGYASTGDRIGGYDAHVEGWVQTSSTYYPGGVLTPSVWNGAQYEMSLVVQLYAGNWWIAAFNQWIGYYPASLFNSSGLATSSSRVQWYGEVFDSYAPAATFTVMGSGGFANQGWAQAAYMRNMVYFDTPTTTRYVPDQPLYQTDSKCYNGAGPYTNSTPGWYRYYYWGGAGRYSSLCL